jgi:hypothetical protein
MKQKVKDFLNSVVGYVIIGLTAALGAVVYILLNKKQEINALKAQIDLADTQKKVDLIEVDIKQRLEDKQLMQKQVDELNNSLLYIEERRKQLQSEEANKKPDEVEDYWNKK